MMHRQRLKATLPACDDMYSDVMYMYRPLHFTLGDSGIYPASEADDRDRFLSQFMFDDSIAIQLSPIFQSCLFEE